MAFFFYGTLRDPDVLTLVLDRPLTEQDRRPAWLARHRTVRALDQPYPVLVPASGGSVEGTALLRPSERDERRITWFEEDEYRASWTTIRLDDVAVPARVFLPLDTLRPSPVPWDYARWCSDEKAGFLERCAAWLAELDPAHGPDLP